MIHISSSVVSSPSFSCSLEFVCFEKKERIFFCELSIILGFWFLEFILKSGSLKDLFRIDELLFLGLIVSVSIFSGVEVLNLLAMTGS